MAENAATRPHSPDPLRLKDPTSPRNVRSCLPKLVALISGGQTGVDIAALRAAAKLGLATGGYAPLGWRTSRGPRPTLGSEYGLVECWSASYPARTARNVFAACATLRIASDFDSSGEICTQKAIRRYKKRYFDVRTDDVFYVNPRYMRCVPELIAFLMREEVRVLNVAGNSEETSPGIEAAAERFLVTALAEVSP